MVITSTVPDYLALLKAPAGPDRVQAWTSQYEAVHQPVFDTYFAGGWGDRGDIAAATAMVEALADVVPERETRARRVIADVLTALPAYGVQASDAWRCVLLVGVGGANGWVTRLNGAPTLFLALERLPDPPYDAVLVAHELIHLFHPDGEGPDTVASRLWAEGAATALSRLLRPGHADSAYLWFDDDHHDWVTECRNWEPSIRDVALAHLGSIDEAVLRSLFSMPPRPSLPHRCGYWLGDRTITSLIASGVPARDILAIPPQEATQRLLRALSGTPT